MIKAALVGPGRFEVQAQKIIPELVCGIKDAVWELLQESQKSFPELLEELGKFTAMKTGFEPTNTDPTQDQINKILQELLLDLEATKKDPAVALEKHKGAPEGADDYSIIASHTSFHTFALYRFAHLLWELGHFHHALQLQNYLKRTGPEIHPGAKIAPGSVIDHGTATVIGETVVIGESFYAHHSDTLGGIGKWNDIEGGIPWSRYRHPWIGPNVFLSTDVKILSSVILGGGKTVTIGAGSTLDRCILEDGSSVGNGVTLTGVIVPAGIRVLGNKEHDGKYLVRKLDGTDDMIILEELPFEALKQKRYDIAHAVV